MIDRNGLELYVGDHVEWRPGIGDRWRVGTVRVVRSSEALVDDAPADQPDRWVVRAWVLPRDVSRFAGVMVGIAGKTHENFDRTAKTRRRDLVRAGEGR